MSALNYYQLLNIPRDADPEQIRRAYVRLVKYAHPDGIGHLRRPTAHLNDLQRAYRCLLDPEARRLHDMELEISDAEHVRRVRRVQRRLQKRSRPRPDSKLGDAPSPRRTRSINWRLVLVVIAGIVVLAKLRTEFGNPLL